MRSTGRVEAARCQIGEVAGVIVTESRCHEGQRDQKVDLQLRDGKRVLPYGAWKTAGRGMKAATANAVAELLGNPWARRGDRARRRGNR